MQLLYSLFIILALLNLTDVAMTGYIIRKGFGREGNKFMAFLIQRLGLWLGLLLPKLVMLGALFAPLWNGFLHPVALIILIIVYVWVVYHNGSLILEKG